MLDVVEGEQVSEEHYLGCVHLQIIFGLLRQALKPAHGVITEIAHGPGGKRRQARLSDWLLLTHQLAQYIEHRRIDRFTRAILLLNRYLRTRRSHNRVRRATQE